MARINLLPHRAEARKRRQREFFMHLGVIAGAAAAFIFAWWFWMNLRIDNQNERNAYMQDQIKQLDARITKINDLEKVRAQLLARKQIIEQLQANRAQMVHLFDELVKTIPGTARITSLKQNGDLMVLSGVAQSNASVAEYMRNIEVSPWMGQADLSKTENSHDSSRMPYNFGLSVALAKPKQDDANGQGANGPASSSSASLAPSSSASLPTAPTMIKPAGTATGAPVVGAPAVVTPAGPVKTPAAASTAAVKGGAKP